MPINETLKAANRIKCFPARTDVLVIRFTGLPDIIILPMTRVIYELKDNKALCMTCLEELASFFSFLSLQFIDVCIYVQFIYI